MSAEQYARENPHSNQARDCLARRAYKRGWKIAYRDKGRGWVMKRMDGYGRMVHVYFFYGQHIRAFITSGQMMF